MSEKDVPIEDFIDDQEVVPETSITSSLDETAVGEVPSDWKITRLGDIAIEREYGLTETAEDYDPNKPRYIRTQDFDDHGGLKKDSRASLSWDKAEDALLEQGDMLFARSGSIGASLGKIYLYNPDHGPCCYGGYSIRHRLQKEGLNHQYITQFALSDRYWDWIRRIAKTTAQSNINTGEYGSLPIPIPPLEEQRKIATVLQNVDKGIKVTNRIIEQLASVQTCLLHALFGEGGDSLTSGRDTKDERLGPKKFQVPTSWEITHIGDIGRVITGDTPPTNNEDNFGGDLLFVTPEILSKGKYVDESRRTLSAAGRKLVKPIPEGAVMMDCIGSDMGKVAIAEKELATNQQINSVVIEKDSYLPEFLYYHLLVLSDFIKSQAGQTATPIVNKSSFESFAVFRPPIEEQQNIVDILSTYDESTQINREYLTCLKRLKEALVQDLISGSVRTTDTNIEVLPEVAAHG